MIGSSAYNVVLNGDGSFTMKNGYIYSKGIAVILGATSSGSFSTEGGYVYSSGNNAIWTNASSKADSFIDVSGGTVGTKSDSAKAAVAITGSR